MMQRARISVWGLILASGPVLLAPLAATRSIAADDETTVQQAQAASIKARQEEIARAYAKADSASNLQSIAPLVHFEAVNPGEPAGDRLGPARRLAAAVIAQDKPAPNLIVDVGSFTGELLEGFMQRFPDSHGQWTEPVTNNLDNAKKRFARFGKNVDFVVGCASRDISLGCVPKGVDVLLTSWLSIHQNLEGIRRFYKEAADMLPSGGWVVNLDHVAYGGSPWEARLQAARDELAADGIDAVVEGPPVHHPSYVTPSVEDQMTAFRDAGFTDVQIVWRRLNTVLFMARKH
jgi:SAM-dependent methyltransferase